MPSVLKRLVKGSRKIVDNMRKWTNKTIKRKSTESVRDACKQLVGYMRDEMDTFRNPTGAMSKAIGYKIVKYNGGKTTYGVVGVRKNVASVMKLRRGRTTPNPRKYLHLVVYGTKAHSLGMSRGKVTYRPYVNRTHPGSKPNDFVARAFARAKANVANKFRNNVRHNWETNTWAA